MGIEQKVDKYRFGIETIDVSIPDSDEPIKIFSDKIHTFMIDRDYDNNIMPVCKLTASVFKYDYYKILSNIDKCKFMIRLTKSKYSGAPEGKNETFKNSYISLVMCALSDVSTPNPSSGMDRANYEMVNQNDNITPDDFIDIQLSLFDVKALKNFKSMLNINSTTTPISAVAYILRKSGFNALISPPDNNTSRHMIMPEKDMLDSIEYIHRMYGIYNSGYRIFSDLDSVLYFLNNEFDSKAFRKDEIQNVYINVNELTTDSASVYGSYDDENCYSINVSSKDLEVRNMSTGMKEIAATKIKTINNSGASTTNTCDVEGFDTGDTVTIVEDKNNNPYYLNSKMYKLKESKTIVELSAPEVDISILTPNKKYNLVYKGDIKMNQTIGGHYKISRVITIFERDANMFSVNNALRIKKV